MALRELLELVCHHERLQRELGGLEMKKFLTEASAEDFWKLQVSIADILKEQPRMEQIIGILHGIKVMIKHDAHSEHWTLEFIDEVIERSLDYLTEDEGRIRLLAGEVLGELCKKIGPDLYEKCRFRVLELIRSNLEPNPELPEDDETEGECPSLRRSYIKQGIDNKATWKYAATAMKCLREMVKGCGKTFQPWINQELFEVIFKAANHSNHFIREFSFNLLTSLINSATQTETTETEEEPYENPFSASSYGYEVSSSIGMGLSDNSSHVRLAASKAVRKFLLSCNAEAERKLFYPELIPKMCLNRYHSADGVRIYSQDTWIKVTESEGSDLVEKHIYHVVDHYTSQGECSHPVAREVACICVLELASKVNADSLRPFLPRLLEMLLACFKDDCWTVRDSACVATGTVVMQFPYESRSLLDRLYPLFLKNLQDSMTSTRQGAAIVLANVVRAYGKEAFTFVTRKMEEGLRQIEDQEPDSEIYPGIDKGPLKLTEALKLKYNDVEFHTNKDTFSCSTMSPASKTGDFEEDAKLRKQSEPWELADGCIYLAAELSKIPSIANEMAELLPILSISASYRHYSRHVQLLDTLCKQLPVIAEGIGETRFLQKLEFFLDHIFYSLRRVEMSSFFSPKFSAASDCLDRLSKFLGPMVLKTYIKHHNPQYLRELEGNETACFRSNYLKQHPL